MGILQILQKMFRSAPPKPWLDVELIKSRQLKCRGCGDVFDKSWEDPMFKSCCPNCTGAD